MQRLWRKDNSRQRIAPLLDRRHASEQRIFAGTSGIQPTDAGLQTGPDTSRAQTAECEQALDRWTLITAPIQPLSFQPGAPTPTPIDIVMAVGHKIGGVESSNIRDRNTWVYQGLFALWPAATATGRLYVPTRTADS